MKIQQAVKIITEEKSWESDDRKIDAFNEALTAMQIVDYLIKNKKEYYNNLLGEMSMDR